MSSSITNDDFGDIYEDTFGLGETGWSNDKIIDLIEKSYNSSRGHLENHIEYLNQQENDTSKVIQDIQNAIDVKSKDA